MRALLLLTMAILACAGTNPAQSKATYDDDVRPILEARCIRCHNADRDAGGLALDAFARTMAGGSSGEVVNAGDADGSKLVRVIEHAEGPKMPPGGKLDAGAIATIRRWIEGGALENRSSKAKPKRAENAAFTAITADASAGPAPSWPPLSLEPTVAAKRASPVVALAVNPRAPIAAVASYRQVLLYDTDSLALVGVLPFPEGMPHAITFSRDGRLLVVGGGHDGARGGVAVWSVERGARVLDLWREPDAVLAVDLSADGSHVVVGGPAKTAKLYTTADGQVAHRLRGATDWVTAVRFSPDGSLVAAGDRAGNVFVWETATGAEYLTPDPHRGRISAIDWRPDGKAFATASEDGAVVIWRTRDGARQRRFTAHRGGVTALRWHADGTIATAGRDKRAHAWRVDGRALRRFDGPKDIALSVAITADGDGMLAGDWRGRLHRWTLKNGKVDTVVTAHPEPIGPRIDALERDVAGAAAALRTAIAANATAQRDAREAAVPLAGLRDAREAAVRARRAARTTHDAAEAAWTRANAAIAADPDDLARVRAVHRALGRRYRARCALASAEPAAADAIRRHDDAVLADRSARGAATAASATLRDARARHERATRDLARWQAEQALATATAAHVRTAERHAKASRAEADARGLLDDRRSTAERIADEQITLEARAEAVDEIAPALAHRAARIARLHDQTDAQRKLAETRLTFAEEALRLARAIGGGDGGIESAGDGLPSTLAALAKAGESLGGLTERLATEAREARAAVERLRAILAAARSTKRAGDAVAAASARDARALATRIAALGAEQRSADAAVAEAVLAHERATAALRVAEGALRYADDVLAEARDAVRDARATDAPALVAGR